MRVRARTATGPWPEALTAPQYLPLVGEVDRPKAGREGDSPQARCYRHAMPHTNIDPRTRSTAKRLRRDQTDAERKMWRLLRPFRDDGITFRR